MSDVPSNLVMWSGIVGFFLPILIATILRWRWSQQAKAVAAFVVCLIAATGTAYFSGNFEGADVVTAALVVVTITQATYVGVWKPTGVAPAIMDATG